MNFILEIPVMLAHANYGVLIGKIININKSSQDIYLVSLC